MKIKSIRSYEVLDSRGYPTVACEIIATNGMKAKAMVPSGASTGEREAIELRDNDKKRYMGKGVLKAVENVNKIIAPYLIKKNINIEDQNAIDKEMIKLDGTNNKNKFGANAILSVSMAITKLGALIKNKPLYKYINEDVAKLNSKTYILPLPMLNVINGGAHADNTIDFQEFMFIPVGAKNIRQACQISSECFHNLAKLLKTKGFNTSKGDEGGFAPLLKNADEALSFMTDAIKLAGYKPGVKADVAIAMDTACSELYDDVNKKYFFEKALKANIIDKKNGIKTTDEMIEYLDKLTKKYPIISIEDGLAEND
jgi:enolase